MEIVQEIYETTISSLPSAKRLKLASLILEKLSQEPLKTEVKPERQSMIDLLESWEGQRLFKTAAEADVYLREERDSWDR